LSEGHISYYRTYRGPDVLRNVIVLGYVAFYPINKLLVIVFYRLTKCLRGQGEMASRAAFGPRVIVWRPCYRTLIV